MMNVSMFRSSVCTANEIVLSRERRCWSDSRMTAFISVFIAELVTRTSISAASCELRLTGNTQSISPAFMALSAASVEAKGTGSNSIPYDLRWFAACTR